MRSATLLLYLTPYALGHQTPVSAVSFEKIGERIGLMLRPGQTGPDYGNACHHLAWQLAHYDYNEFQSKN